MFSFDNVSLKRSICSDEIGEDCMNKRRIETGRGYLTVRWSTIFGFPSRDLVSRVLMGRQGLFFEVTIYAELITGALEQGMMLPESAFG